MYQVNHSGNKICLEQIGKQRRTGKPPSFAFLPIVARFALRSFLESNFPALERVPFPNKPIRRCLPEMFNAEWLQGILRVRRA